METGSKNVASGAKRDPTTAFERDIKKGGTCTRQLNTIDGKELQMKHTWKIAGDRGVAVQSWMLRSFGRKGKGTKTIFVANDFEALSEECRDQALCLVPVWKRLAGGRGVHADPVAAALNVNKAKKRRLRVKIAPQTAEQGARTVNIGGATVKFDALREFLSDSPAEVMDALGVRRIDVASAEQVSMAAEDHAVAAATHRAVKISLSKAKQQWRTELGRQAYQTILTTVVGPSNAERSSEEGGGEKQVTQYRLARGLGVPEEIISNARARANRMRHDSPPTEAPSDGSFWWAKCSERKDNTSPEVLSLTNDFRQLDNYISRTSRDSGTHVDQSSQAASAASAVTATGPAATPVNP